MRIEDSIKALSQLKQNGYNVGSLNWKAPKDFRSFTYIQSGFEFDSKNGQTVLSLSKLADVPLIKHRTIPDTETIKQVTIKKEPTGDWFASFVVDGKETPEKPTDPDRCVGIDVGILKYAHDTDGYAIESPDFSDERERLERAQRDLSRKEHGSTNWETQRQTVAERHADLKRKRRDFLHKLSNYYATEYDLVAVEDLDVKGLVELPRNSRNRAGVAWGTFLGMLEYKCEREGTHFVAVNPRGTTKECASCGMKTEKPLWMREHSCPACGFEADRDANAAWNILSRGLEEVGVGYSESTPVETALPVDTPVSAKRVVETGSPTLKERTAS
ncbi:putative transposase, partial [Halorubrum ezzemoulense]